MKTLHIKNRRLAKPIDAVPIEINAVPLLDANSKVFTMGSCFALSLRNYMAAQGRDVLDQSLYGKGGLLRYLVWYNTFTMLYEFQKADGTWIQDDDDIWLLKDGRFQDPYRTGVFGKSKEDILEKIHTIDACIARCIKEADCVVLTLGLTEVWFQNCNYRAIRATPGHPAGRGGGMDSHFRFTGFSENYNNAADIIEILLDLNPKCNVVITVSPVPLARTFLPTDHLIANTEGKSILRAVAGAMAEEFRHVHYFHAYELAMNAKRERVFRKDGRHVRPEYAAYIVAEFEKFFMREQ